MNKIIMIGLLLIFICFIPTIASADWQGIDAWTGDEWQTLQPSSKPAFLQGMIEGLKFRGPDMGPWEPIAEEVERYIQAIEELYEDQENRDIPIVLILDYVNSELAGMDKEELDLRLEDLRKIAQSY